jgi:transcriptional regulator with XRE-family HTH domain
MEFSAALAHLVSKKGRGAQEALAKQVRITPQYISRLARGERSGAEDVRRKIASALGYSYDEFLALGRALLRGDHSSSIGSTSDELIRKPVERGSGSCCVAGASELPPETKDLVSLAVEILTSETKYARLLAENIRSFHESIQFTERIESLEGELTETREMTINLVERMAAMEIAERERLKMKGRREGETPLPESSPAENQKTAG